MKLYLLRHGKAEEKNSKKQDKNRKLTSQGKSECYKKAKKFRNKLDAVDVILTSPLPRAYETAEIFAAVLGKQDLIKEDDRLDTSAQAKEVLKLLRNMNRFKDIMLVGHEPWMSEFISLMISGTINCQINLKKSGLAILVVETLQPKGATLQILR